MLGNIRLLLRFTIAVIFIISGFEKVVSPTRISCTFCRRMLLPPALEKIAAFIFPWVELGLGVFLALGLWLRPVLVGLACMSASLILVVGQAIVRGLPIDSCGCFGNLVHLPLRGVIFLDVSILTGSLVCLSDIKAVRRFSVDKVYGE